MVTRKRSVRKRRVGKRKTTARKRVRKVKKRKTKRVVKRKKKRTVRRTTKKKAKKRTVKRKARKTVRRTVKRKTSKKETTKKAARTPAKKTKASKKSKKCKYCIVKRRGNKQAYDEKKVYGTCYAACRDAQLDHAHSERLCEKVTKHMNAWAKKKKSVKSDQIFAKMIILLKKHNHAAAFMYQTHRDLC